MPERVSPKDFYSDHPPQRIMGTEMEYDADHLAAEGSIMSTSTNADIRHVIHGRGIGDYDKIIADDIFTGNGSRIYRDSKHIEYASPESLGPL